MFAYCNNSPINYSDPAGHAIWGTNTVAVNDGGCKTENNPFFWNEHDRPYYARIDEDEAKNAAKRILGEYAYVKYRGVSVFKIPFMKDAGFSCGCILIGSEIQYDEYGIATLNHEYGHYIQLTQLGWYDYITKMMIPSLKGYWFSQPGVDYYSQPWEYLAIYLETLIDIGILILRMLTRTP